MWGVSQTYGSFGSSGFQHPTSDPPSIHIFSPANGRYDLAVKNLLVAAGGTGSTFTACTAPPFVPIMQLDRRSPLEGVFRTFLYNC